MDLDLNTLVGERFSTLQLTMGVNKRQNEYGLLNGMGLFDEVGITERFVRIETRNQTLSIIPTSPTGTPAPSYDDPDDRGELPPIPTFRHAKMHQILAESMQGVRAFGTEDMPEMVDLKVMEALDKIQREHRQTKEFLRWSALRGVVYDVDGARQLYNVYSLMGETQKVIEWDLDNANAVDPIQAGNDELTDYLEDNALGETVTGVVKFCSPGYMTKMKENKAFREAYRYFSERIERGEVNPHRDTLNEPFYFKGVTYVRHRGSASYKKKDGTVVKHKFIPDNEAIAVPLGTYDCFKTFFGPAEFMETVNTIGQEIYVKPEVMKLNLGIELHSFSHALNLVTKPRLVTRCTVKA